MIKWYIDHLHVSTPDEEIREDFEKRCKKANFDKEKTEEIVQIALARHHENQEDYRWVMGSH